MSVALNKWHKLIEIGSYSRIMYFTELVTEEWDFLTSGQSLCRWLLPKHKQTALMSAQPWAQSSYLKRELLLVSLSAESLVWKVPQSCLGGLCIWSKRWHHYSGMWSVTVACRVKEHKYKYSEAVLGAEFAMSGSITILSEHRCYNCALASLPVSHCLARCPERDLNSEEKLLVKI